ncbi:hypothetical protein Tco_0544753 [Tanacetum coccineum]
MNQNYYDPNSCYNFNSSGFDQYQPSQYSVTHQTPMEELLLEEKLHQALCEKLDKNVQEKQEEKNVAEEQAAKVSSQYWKPPIYYDDDDDDEESSIPLRVIISELPLSFAIVPDFPITDSLIMEDEHLNTIPETKSDEENESSVKDLNLTPSEFEDLSEDLSVDLTDHENECDMPVCNESSSKNEADFDPKEDIRLIEKMLNDDSSPKELNFEIHDAIIESFSPSPIPVEDSDSLMEEIDIFLSPDDSIPPGIENDDYDSEGDVLFLEELLNNDSISLLEYESFHVDLYNVPSSPRPPEKPPDDDVYFDIEPDAGVLTTKVVDNISDNSTRELYVLPILTTLSPVIDTLLLFLSENKDKVFNSGILASNEEKSPHLPSHRGFKASQIIYFSESPMMIYREDIPILDVPFLHFYPP